MFYNCVLNIIPTETYCNLQILRLHERLVLTYTKFKVIPGGSLPNISFLVTLFEQ